VPSAKMAPLPIPKGANVIDAPGKFILPGLIDCHCHLEDVGLGDLGSCRESGQRLTNCEN